ncbi:MAG: T9SS type A sorting domain-containing protein [Bacteroidaceae bacterium]|nr:T9SS type A sorting domain-containing protein [Bacteroidaceae bacterium]
MKKIFLTIILAAAAMNINAQLVVDSIGQVGIGTETPKSLLSVGGNGNNSTSFYCNAQSKNRGMTIINNSDTTSVTYGLYLSVQNDTGNCVGGRSIAKGDNIIESSQCVIGLHGTAGDARTAVGVYGTRFLTSGIPVNFAGIYGAESGDTPSFTNYPGIYAGYFNGKVRVTNGIYATVLSPSASPSPSGQGGTTILSDRGESVTDKLSGVQTLQFLRNNPDETIEEEPEPYLSPIQYGLAADQLKAVYPELVYEDANGNVSINYVEMIPLLVQSINELKSELAELKGTSSKKAKSQTTAIEETVPDIDMVRMDQNKPNPFSESTVINLNIPDKAQIASIFIYDMSGKQVQNIAVSERGETNITVYASDLSAGMYIYTLVVDGKVAVTRRMIVSKI